MKGSLVPFSSISVLQGASEHSVPCDLGDVEPEGGLTQPGVPGQCFWDGGEALEQPGGASIPKVEPEWGQGSL